MIIKMSFFSKVGVVNYKMRINVKILEMYIIVFRVDSVFTSYQKILIAKLPAVGGNFEETDQRP